MFTIPKNSTITTETVKMAIEANETDLKTFQKLRDYYDGNHIILEKKRSNIENDFRNVVNHAEWITDMNVGYFLGDSVQYISEDVDTDAIHGIYNEEAIADLDYDLGEHASIYGLAYEYVYADEDANVNSTVFDPRNCVIGYDDTVKHDILFAVTYESDDKKEGEDKYSNVFLYTYKEILEVDLKSKLMTVVAEHKFGEVPFIKYKNNKSQRGDFEMVITSIDAYNLLQSERVNDKQQLVDSLLLLYGITLTKEQKQDVKRNRILSGLPKKTDGTAIEYLIKNLNELDVETLKKSIEYDIHKISKTPNMSDENFAGNLSGVALKFKLLPFEIHIQAKERYFRKGLKKRLRLYNKYIQITNEEVDLTKIRIVFNRALPQNDFETAQMIQMLQGSVDNKTLVSQLSFIENPDEVDEIVQEEKVSNLANMMSGFATANPSDSNV